MTSMQEPSLVIDLHYPADACLYAYSEVDPQALQTPSLNNAGVTLH